MEGERITTDSGHRFGFVALVGRPNAGKSTLLNRLVGEKVSIVTHKPQTTRHRITGVYSSDLAQIVYVDTPGLHQGGRHLLNRRMNQVAEAALDDVDIAVVMVDALTANQADRAIVRRVAASSRPWFLVLNKIDHLDDRGRLLPLTEQLTQDHAPAGVFYLSARRGDGVDDLQQALIAHLPEGPPLFESDRYTDRSLRFLVAELIREQLLLNLHQELPYGTTVQIETYSQTPELTRIGAAIHVATDRHKGMVIGRGGETLKRIGSRARHEIEKLLDGRVHLELWVRTDRDWMNDPARLERFEL